MRWPWAGRRSLFEARQAAFNEGLRSARLEKDLASALRERDRSVCKAAEYKGAAEMAQALLRPPGVVASHEVLARFLEAHGASLRRRPQGAQELRIVLSLLGEDGRWLVEQLRAEMAALDLGKDGAP